jgi:hypothetical protein
MPERSLSFDRFYPVNPGMHVAVASTQRAEALGGSASERSCRSASTQHGGRSGLCSLPQLAAELGTSAWMVRAAMDAHRIPRLPGQLAKGRARKAASNRYAAERAAQLGFPVLGPC